MLTLQVTHPPVFQSLTRPPTTNEWQRFRGYAARIVELFVGDRHGAMVSSETISFFGMQSMLESDPLLPRLTSFGLSSVKRWGSGDTSSILTLLSPKITALTLTLPHHRDILFQPVLSVTSDRCRCLQKLVLDFDSSAPHPPGAVEGLITACRDTLRTLEIKSFSGVEYLPMAVNLPQLRSLKLEKAQIPHDFPPSVFQSLEELIILRFDGGPLQRFFKRFQTTDLKAVKIHGFHAIPLKESMAALSRFSASLEVLEISRVTNLHLPSAITPHPFSNLRTLRIGCSGLMYGTHTSCKFRANDKFITELGVAMPNITHLTLGNPTCPRIKCITFPSLVILSNACKHLEALTIRVNFRSMVATSLPESEDVKTGAIIDGTQGSACRLRKLVVGLSTLPHHPDSGWVIAIGLWKLFPSLSEVVGSGQDGWDKVGRNVRMLRRTIRTAQR